MPSGIPGLGVVGAFVKLVETVEFGKAYVGGDGFCRMMPEVGGA